MQDSIYDSQLPDMEPSQSRKPWTYIVLGIIAILVLAAIGYLVYTKALKKPSPTNGNANDNANVAIHLPENHDVTPEERKALGIPDGISGQVKYSLVNGTVAQYFEITSDTRPTDSDGDGLPDSEEAKNKTDQKNPDSDGDGWRDGDEVSSNCDPTKKDGDADGLEDLTEFSLYHTDCRKADTDGDGLNDGDEIKHTCDPLIPDTNGDGVTDGKRVNELRKDCTPK